MPSPTPPELKWLLVERATLAGDLQKLEERRAMLDAEMTATRGVLSSLDTTIGILESRLRPDAAGVVRRHGDYGRHGALTDFIVEMLKPAAAGVLPRDITLGVAAHFDIVFASKAEFLRFHRNTVHARLSALKRRGLAERIPIGPNSVIWRWRKGLPTLAELRSEAAVLARGVGDTDVPNTAGHQMAHQRGGNAAG
ncbi:MAG: hypothetical protein V4508_19105 [Pseudomonadota bacterium]